MPNINKKQDRTVKIYIFFLTESDIAESDTGIHSKYIAAMKIDHGIELTMVSFVLRLMVVIQLYHGRIPERRSSTSSFNLKTTSSCPTILIDIFVLDPGSLPKTIVEDF